MQKERQYALHSTIEAFLDERTTVHRLARTAASPRSDVRSARWALRLERTRIQHWRRLVRARIDLAVASAVLPDPLGQDAAGVLPVDIERDLPDDLELANAVLAGLASGELDRLGDLRALDRRLASYESTVSEALGGATAQYISQLAAEPAACLEAPRPSR
ncbi:MAG: hypothetical protein ACOH2F_14275 [Cellulomonas sp.]